MTTDKKNEKWAKQGPWQFGKQVFFKGAKAALADCCQKMRFECKTVT